VWHAVEIVPGQQFVVSYSAGDDDDEHYVCIVNTLGQILGRCYSGQRGSVIGQLEYPVHLSIVEGFVLVACLKTSSPRIIQLSRTLIYSGTILTDVDGLKGPYGTHYDRQTKHLYVADNTETFSLVSGTVKVFDIALDPLVTY